MKNKRLLVLIGSLCLILVLVTLLLPACAKEEAPAEVGERTYHWRVYSHLATEHFSSTSALRWIERIEEASDGRITMDFYPESVLGDWVPTIAEVMKGTIEIFYPMDPTAVYDPRFDAFYLPYLITSWEDVGEEFCRGGGYFNLWQGIVGDIGLEAINFVPLGFGDMYLDVPPPENYAEPRTSKGLKIRIFPGESSKYVVESMGYKPTSVPWADISSAIRTGVIDGMVGPDFSLAWSQFRDVMSHVVVYRAWFFPEFNTMNKELWDGLSPEDQQILLDAGLAEEELLLDEAIAAEEESRQKLIDYGVELIELTPEELEAMAQAVREDVWPELESGIGKKLMDDILAVVGK